MYRDDSKYRNFFENSPDAMLIVENGKFVACNPAAVAMLSYDSKDEIINKKPFQLSPKFQPGGRSSFDKANEMMLLAKEKGNHRFEWNHLRKDGSILQVEISLTSLETNDGIQLHAIWRDLSKRTQIEQALRENEKKLRAILNHHFQLTGLMSADGKLLMANETALKLTGAKESDVIGRYFWDTPWWSHSLALQEELKSAIKKASKGEFVRFETTHPDGVGNIHTVDFSITPLSLNEDQKIDYLIPEGRDITNIKKDQKALLESEERFRSIFESASAPMAIVAPNGTFLQVNQSACRFFGYDAEEFQNLNMDDLTFPADLEKIHEQNQELISGIRTSIEYEKRYLRKDGSTVWGHSTMATVRDPEGNILHIVALTQNITEQKRAEYELVKYKDHLESLVDERTQELREAQDELLQQERLAVLGKLTATVSHELRNPLGTIRNTMFTIAEGIEQGNKSRVLRAVELAERNVQRCDNIIHELLYYIRKRAIDSEYVHIDTWLKTILEEHEITGDIEYVFALKSNIDLPIEKESLRRAVINVIDNAVQAFVDDDSEGKRILVETEVSRDRLEIRVVDNGPGIPEEIKDKIFEPLFSTKSFGVGLGLSIVKNILEEHRGGIVIESREKKGTTVTLWLPVSA